MVSSAIKRLSYRPDSEDDSTNRGKTDKRQRELNIQTCAANAPNGSEGPDGQRAQDPCIGWAFGSTGRWT